VILLIIIPSLENSGPIKGALAIYNLLESHFKAKLIVLKKNSGNTVNLPKKIELIDLSKMNFIHKFLFIRRYCKVNKNIKIISICFSADILNLFSGSKVEKICSIRGNLIKNYKYHYPYIGKIIAIFHLFLQRFYTHSIVMNRSMYLQVQKYANKKPIIIKNFIDEKSLNKFFKEVSPFSKVIKYIYVGTLTSRKGIDILLEAFKQISHKNFVHLDIVGDGPLKKTIKNKINQLSLKKKVTLHGYKRLPYKLIANSDVFVLPSYSEGTSRALLEALFLGIPAVIRDVDGNSELKKNKNIYLFKKNNELENAMIQQAIYSKSRKYRNNLLPKSYREKSIIKSYLNLLRNK